MREIVVISGKGGAGKTSISGAFAHLARHAVLCDFDVDTPDMHLLLAPECMVEQPFWSGHEAVINTAQCIRCGLCADMCHFDAIAEMTGHFSVNALRCEGCKVCVEFCPERAITFEPKHCGDWFVSKTRFGIMVHAQLYPGEENSGLLVSRLKQEARKLAEEQGAEFILSDGAPGIGCPVISSLRGAALAVVVTEPTPSGRHDFERVALLCDHFRLPVAVIINKCDLNAEEADGIRALCQERGYTYVGALPYDRVVTDAMVAQQVVTEFSHAEFSQQLTMIWAAIAGLAGVNQS